MLQQPYYLGFTVSDTVIGWAVTDSKYNILRKVKIFMAFVSLMLLKPQKIAECKDRHVVIYSEKIIGLNYYRAFLKKKS